MSDHTDGSPDPFEDYEISVEKNGDIENPHTKAAPAPTDETTESILANELNKLSFTERETINEEIHCVNIGNNIEETPENLTEYLRGLQTELENLCSTDGSAKGIAFAFKRSQDIFGSTPEKGTIFNSKDFRLMFLRCERFDCKKAALRLCYYADVMYEMYGDFALERKNKLSDMTEDELAIMKLGHCQYIPHRDRAGRRIYVHFYSETWDHLSTKQRMRICQFYFVSMLSNDVDCQSRGMVLLFWMHNVNFKLDSFMARSNVQTRLTRALPFRVGAAHYFFPSSDTYEKKGSFALAKILCRVANNVKPYIRVHWGSPMECLYTLESFGVGAKYFPLDVNTGQIERANNNRTLDLYAAIERNPKVLNKIVEYPHHSDILLGRGQIVMNHPGNIMFRNYIQSKLDLYTNIRSKKESTRWTWDVVRTFKTQYGARFLKEERIDTDLTAWFEISNELARSKVRIAFRDARTRLAKCAGKQISSIKSNGTSSIKKNEDTFQIPIKSSSWHEGNNFEKTIPHDPISSKLSSLNQIDSKTKPESNATDVPVTQFNTNLRELNNNLRQLNNNLNAMTSQRQSSDSSTSAFLTDNSTEFREEFFPFKFCW
mmetsp:Transcript_9233/g.22680  ORF Transcript_9233/g.22680 Transcript_9233/m.22680 type:complete len:602 (+) Transcript_9233:39-1844(+)|eukprot:CAMPEP_0197185812 /NCGR_PEP_ID=MMETSP1423-20130617/12723_1 /TAXON_ID=476441 /ORGANISM="Pseudo-nitzschia heimii, Strain UNC1101" /LENGTH=601 /DNA_ID=CAMNT_0042636967 /DNA_START=23 /DNA_END=1828 /DNA_ORIENTATION=+